MWGGREPAGTFARLSLFAARLFFSTQGPRRFFCYNGVASCSRCSEINCCQLWEQWLLCEGGLETNGFVAEGHFRTWAGVEEWMTAMARIHYPIPCSPGVLVVAAAC
jgi:hypothetical protein